MCKECEYLLSILPTVFLDRIKDDESHLLNIGLSQIADIHGSRVADDPELKTRQALVHLETVIALMLGRIDCRRIKGSQSGDYVHGESQNVLHSASVRGREIAIAEACVNSSKKKE